MPATEEDIRTAAENLLQSSQQHQNVQSPAMDMSHSQSVNTIPSIHTDYIITEDLVSGQRINGSMSNVRRFFCLFVTFDLLFTCLMWLICVMLTGEDITTALNKQIYHYNVHTSLFDVVLAALCRFTVLLLFYALLYINHWIIISVTTAFTCAFLIAKVFVYNWTNSQQPAFEVLLILTSFVLSWGETWFLDFRVLPQEQNARRYFVASPNSERAPLIRSYVQGLPSMYTESVGNFYSPLQSPEGSLYRVDAPNRCTFPPVRFTREQEDKYKDLGKKCLEDAWSLLHHADWKLDKTNAAGDTVHSLSLPKMGKVFKLSAVLDVPAKYLLDELFYKIENLPKWNPNVLESLKIQPIDEYTDITYQVSTDGGAGLVSSRDFVTLRYWTLVNERYVIASTGIEHPSVPKNDKYVRGENRVGCWVIENLPGEANKCQFQWLLNTDLKGWIAQYIIDVALVGVLFNYIKHLREHIRDLKKSGRLV